MMGKYGCENTQTNFADIEMGTLFGAWCSAQEHIIEPTRTISVWRSACMVRAKPFRDAITEAGPMTHEHSLVWHVESLYAPVKREYLSRMYLVNFGKGVTVHGPSVLDWGRNHQLEPASPASVMALCAQIPRMHIKVGSDLMGILATDAKIYDGVLRTCCVWNGTAMKSCALVPFAYPLHDGFWFAFESKRKRSFGGTPWIEEE
jgi:hypothetical protein